MQDHGLRHGNLHERNVLVHNGHPRIIDLESADAHDCGIRMTVIPGATAPTAEEFGCDELHNLIKRMFIWRPGLLLLILW
ncbi:hypothetical protein B0H17DRAFT_937566 [Mycena rosella]|uniref:Protein kinase domain-containing protein n=1 Tax=Mycena rosella TaxID=1033263 RepID=A0AAD7DE14_MYCRO|nr:hypothetical protein B0H17DRAFT_937566 [Mycena rosella]